MEEMQKKGKIRSLGVSNFYLEDLEMSDVETETGIRESHAAKDDFINKQKSANTNMKTATDLNMLNTLGRVKTLPAKELVHLLFTEFFLIKTRRKNGEEYEPTTIFNFQRRIVQNEKKRRTVIERDEED